MMAYISAVLLVTLLVIFQSTSVLSQTAFAPRPSPNGYDPNRDPARAYEENIMQCARQGAPIQAIRYLEECYSSISSEQRAQRRSNGHKMSNVIKCMLIKGDASNNKSRRVEFAKLRTSLGNVDNSCNLGKAISYCEKNNRNGPNSFPACIVNQLNTMCEDNFNPSGSNERSTVMHGSDKTGETVSMSTPFRMSSTASTRN